MRQIIDLTPEECSNAAVKIPPDARAGDVFLFVERKPIRNPAARAVAIAQGSDAATEIGSVAIVVMCKAADKRGVALLGPPVPAIVTGPPADGIGAFIVDMSERVAVLESLASETANADAWARPLGESIIARLTALEAASAQREADCAAFIGKPRDRCATCGGFGTVYRKDNQQTGDPRVPCPDCAKGRALIVDRDEAIALASALAGDILASHRGDIADFRDHGSGPMSAATFPPALAQAIAAGREKWGARVAPGGDGIYEAAIDALGT